MQTLSVVDTDSAAEVLPGVRDPAIGDIDIDWKKPPTLRSLKKNLEDAIQYQSTHVEKIDRWLDNLHVQNSAKPPKRKGRSSHVPKVIRRQAEWRYSSLTEPFTAPKELFKASPVTWDDKQAAIQNQLYLNHQFNHKIDRGEFIDEYVRTGVDQGTIFVRVGWEFDDTTVEEEQPVFDLIPDPAAAEQLQQLAQLQQENPNSFEFDVPQEWKIALEESTKNGTPLRPEVTGTKLVQRQKILKNQPTLKICNYRNLYIDPTCEGNLDDAKFIIYSFETSYADLVKDKRYKNLDKINIQQSDTQADTDHSTTAEDPNFTFEDKARKKLLVYECWAFMDVNGDDTLQPVVLSWIGDTFIWMSDNPFPDQGLPFVGVKYMPVAKSVYGEPDGALLEDHQKVMGAIMRGMIDILARSANAQTGRRRDMLDAVNKRKYERGEDYEFNGNVDPRQSFFMHKFEEIPNSAQFMVELMNREAEGLTGVKAFSGGLSGDALGDVATAVRGVLDSASKRELGILRRLAAGLIKIAKKITAMNGEFLSETEVVRVTNDHFVPVRRDELNGEFDLELTISTAEEDEAKAQELAFMLQTMGNNVDFGVTKKLLVEMFRLRKMPDLAKAIEEYEPQPDPVEEKRRELEIAELEAKIRKLHSEAAENEAEAGLDDIKAQALQVKSQRESIEADKKALDYVEQESGVTHERDLEKMGAQAAANMELEHVKHGLKKDSDAQKHAAELQKQILHDQMTQKSPTQ